MDYLNSLFAGQTTDKVLERAFIDADGDLEDAIDIILRATTTNLPEPPCNTFPKLEALPLAQTLHRPSTSLLKADTGTLPPDPGVDLRKFKRRRKETPNFTSPTCEASSTTMKDRVTKGTNVAYRAKTVIVLSDDEDEVVEDDLALINSPPEAIQATEEECWTKLMEVFPDICRDYVAELYKKTERKENIPEQLILKILDEDSTYPKEKDRLNRLKRKRQDEQAEEVEQDGDGTRVLERTYESEIDRIRAKRHYDNHARALLQNEFADIPASYIHSVLTEKTALYPAYLALELTDRTLDTIQNPPYRKLNRPRKVKDPHDMLPRNYKPEMAQHWDGRNNLLAELHSARVKRNRDHLNRQEEQDAKVAASINEKEHVETGMMMECQCCFDECPFDKMTHCDGDDCHFFCLECAKRNANNEIGQSRYKLLCMDGSGCRAEFSREQIRRFLDTKTIEGLSRIQQEDEIRMAELEGLTNCPFCDFAAICPPVEEDREFRCRNSACERVSCRLCQQETHIPLSCDAFAKENKATIRHAVEEAMTEALVRTCNNCKNKYIKENGCNKMFCTRCRSIQCYVCSKTITDGYKHFDDAGRGGGAGNCPLFDNTDQRHENDVKTAEKAAMAKIRAENPDLSEDDLKVRVSESVLRDEQSRIQAAAARQPVVAFPGPPGYMRPFYPPPQPYHPANFQPPGFPLPPNFHPPNGQADAGNGLRLDWAAPVYRGYYQAPNPDQAGQPQQAPRVFIPHHPHLHLPAHDPAHDQPRRHRSMVGGNRAMPPVPPPPGGPPPNRRRVPSATLERDMQLAERARQQLIEMQAEQAAEVARVVEDQLHLAHRYGIMPRRPNLAGPPGAPVNDFMIAAHPGRLRGPPAI